MKLLVVDDQEEMLEIISEVAACEGWETVSCLDASEVLNIVEQSSIDLALIDYFMPDTTGLDISSQIRERGLTFPIVLISGMVSEIDRSKANQFGITTILEKPLNLGLFRKTLASAVAGAGKSITPR
jgi:CheY-like chemotaxis protein